MSNVNEDGIVTPDEENTLDPEVWSAAMADSISQGLGVRVKKQETRVSLRATTPIPFDVESAAPEDAYMRVPLTVGGVTGIRAPNPDYAGGNHADGVTIVGDVATIVTDGLYSISGQLTTRPGTFATHSWDFFGTINGETFGLPSYGATSSLAYTAGYVFDTRYLVAGDYIELYCGVGTDHIGGFTVQDALLSITLNYAT
jgi:hypothetical protein